MNLRPSLDADVIALGILCEFCGVGASSEGLTFDAAIKTNSLFSDISLVILLFDFYNLYFLLTLDRSKGGHLYAFLGDVSVQFSAHFLIVLFDFCCC